MNRRRFMGLLAGVGAVVAVCPGRVWGGQVGPRTGRPGPGPVCRAGRLDEALEILAEARRLDPRDDRVRALLGRAYFQKGDPVRALEEFRLAVRFNPEDTQSRIMVETISQFPLPAGGKQARQRPPGRPSVLEREAGAERERLLAGSAAPRPAGPFRLLLDPGHGGSDSGAAGPGLREADVTLDVSLRLARLLAGTARERLDVSLTRVADAGLPGWARAGLAAWYGADLLLSLHATRLADPGVSGIAVLAAGREASNPVAAAVARVENAAHGPLPPAGPGAEQAFFTRAVHQAAATGLLRRGGELAGSLAKALSGAGAPLAVRTVGVAPLRLLAEADAPAVLVETGVSLQPGRRGDPGRGRGPPGPGGRPGQGRAGRHRARDGPGGPMKNAPTAGPAGRLNSRLAGTISCPGTRPWSCRA